MTAAPRASRTPEELKAATIERYLTVRHLDDATAGIVLGIGRGSVRTYRRLHPETRPDDWMLVPAHRSAPQREVRAKIGKGSAKATRPSVAPEKRLHIVRAGMWGLGDPSEMAARKVSVAKEPWVMA